MGAFVGEVYGCCIGGEASCGACDGGGDAYCCGADVGAGPAGVSADEYIDSVRSAAC